VETLFRDPTQANLASLVPEMRWRAIEFINALRSVGIPAYISSARRSRAEQARLVAAGRSLDLNSPHLRGFAFDFDVVGFSRSEIPDEFWHIVGPWAEQELDVVWGGRFASLWDPGHFQLPNRAVTGA